MCLMINQRFHKPTITKDGASLFDDSWLEAKEDILVFKDLAHYGFRCVTPYRQMLVKFVDGKFVYGEIKLGIDNKLEIVKEGAHAYVLDWYCNHLAVIPKGSKFFVGYDMDIVSNNNCNNYTNCYQTIWNYILSNGEFIT